MHQTSCVHEDGYNPEKTVGHSSRTPRRVNATASYSTFEDGKVAGRER